MNKILAVVAVLALVAASVLAEEADKKQQKLDITTGSAVDQMDPTTLPALVGLEFGNFDEYTDEQISEMLEKNFPLWTSLHTRPSITPEELKDNIKEYRFEMMRFLVLQRALKFRGNVGDERVLKTWSHKLKCIACLFVVKHLKSLLADEGCDLASDAFGSLCAAIPVVGPFSVPECVEVLKWACGKIAELIEDHITSDSQICYDVFKLSCS